MCTQGEHAGGRQQVEVDREHVNQAQAQKEARGRDGNEAAYGRDVVEERIPSHGRQHAQRDAYDDCHEERGAHKQERWTEAFLYLRGYGLATDQRETHVPFDQLAEPDRVADGEWLVEAKLRLPLGHPVRAQVGTHDRIDQRFDRVAWSKVDENEAEYRNAQQEEY